MIHRIDRLLTVLTSFAYREEYFPELDGMLKATASTGLPRRRQEDATRHQRCSLISRRVAARN